MRISYNWLKEYIDLDLSPEEVAEKLTLLGLEVDYIEDWSKIYNDLLIGLVEEVKPHPEADKLTLVSVGVGEKSFRVICGAPNVKKGQKVVLAPAETTLPNGQEIKKTRIRGEASEGMICSADELKLQEERAEGIFVLDDDAVPGEKFAPFFNLNDQIFVLDLTPNYGYALNLIGVARELSAAFDKEIKYPQIKEDQESGRAEDLISVEVKDHKLCPRYTARIVEGVEVGESPWWLKVRLMTAGIRPVNNIADITNYVMLEMGQPLHAFDYDKIQDKKIVVRTANKGEKLVTLDDRERELTKEDLVIADAQKPLGLAGVMGGLESEINSQTNNILLEAASFDPYTIRRTAKRFILHSPSSHRFERGIDIENITRASRRAVQLMAEIAGGEVIGGIVDNYPKLKEPLRLRIRPRRVNEVLGTDISRMEIKSILEKLHFKVQDSKRMEGAFRVQVPSFRNDISIEADLIEEVARIYGYGEIPEDLPRVNMEIGRRRPNQELEEKIREIFRRAGFHQTFNLPLVHEDENFDQELAKPLALTNPLSVDNSSLRQEILPGLLRSLEFNTKRQVKKAGLYELGDVFPGDGPEQTPALAALLMGAESKKEWQIVAPEFFALKGILETLESELGGEFSLEKSNYNFLHPGRQGEIILNGGKVGYIGELHPTLQEKHRFPERVAVMEMRLKNFYTQACLDPKYDGVPRYPAISRDLALTIEEGTQAAQIANLIKQEGRQLLEELTLFDLYRGEQVPENCKSLAYRMVFRSKERTLTDSEVDNIVEGIIEKAKSEFGAEIRK